MFEVKGGGVPGDSFEFQDIITVGCKRFFINRSVDGLFGVDRAHRLREELNKFCAGQYDLITEKARPVTAFAIFKKYDYVFFRGISFENEADAVLFNMAINTEDAYRRVHAKMPGFSMCLQGLIDTLQAARIKAAA